ncbi:MULTISPECIES: hypothetical protein [unclassified Bradyrhizobium]|uniref:hypothetical protein n=1 Tax=unclassified Bradyrhizobium TaxID=2631580 RepID=UPI0028E74A53|nr:MULTISPECIES: hypothetical protein [unclassified Bradyrhizobium]
MLDETSQITAMDRQLEARLAVVRGRFSVRLVERLQQAAIDLVRMREDEATSAEMVAKTYCWIHEICGIASTIGFGAVGEAARACDIILVEPYRSRRGLETEELNELTKHFGRLRTAAEAAQCGADESRGT